MQFFGQPPANILTAGTITVATSLNMRIEKAIGGR